MGNPAGREIHKKTGNLWEGYGKALEILRESIYENVLIIRGQIMEKNKQTNNKLNNISLSLKRVPNRHYLISFLNTYYLKFFSQ